MALTNENKPVIPTFDEIITAHRTLGALLDNHFKGMNPPNMEDKLVPTMPNKLGIIAAPQPIRK